MYHECWMTCLALFVVQSAYRSLAASSPHNSTSFRVGSKGSYSASKVKLGCTSLSLHRQGRDVRPQHKHFPRAIVQLRHAWYPGDAPNVFVELLQWHGAVREREPNQGVGRVDRLARSSAISVRPSVSYGGSGCARKDVPEHGGRLPQMSIDRAYHVSRNHAVSLQNVHVNSESDPGIVCFVPLEFTIMRRRWRCGWCAVIVNLHTEIHA